MSQETIQRAIQKAKEQVMWGCRTMVDKGYALGTAGNISARVEGEPLFVITTSARPYLTMKPEDLAVGDMDGNVVSGPYKPSIEFSMHLGIYKERPEVNCIVHTHSKFATAVSAMDGVEKVPVIDIEGVVYLGGEILVAPFAPPGSGELAAHVRNTIGTNAGLLMASHGAIGTGLTMEDAMISSDNVERACEMYLAILGAGRQVRKLPEDYMEMAKKKSLVRRNVVL